MPICMYNSYALGFNIEMQQGLKNEGCNNIMVRWVHTEYDWSSQRSLFIIFHPLSLSLSLSLSFSLSHTHTHT